MGAANADGRMRLGVFVQPAGHHVAGWRHPDAIPGGPDIALMRHIASRWGKQGVRSNAILPGFVYTEKTREHLPEEFRRHAIAGTRSTRLGEPSDIAAMVAMLFSDDGLWINGQTLSVDGGATMR